MAALRRLLGRLQIALILSGIYVWLIYRSRNPQHFRRKIPGLANGQWCAAVTMATAGYGDKVPVTSLGRFIAHGWMFTSIKLVLFFAAGTSSIFTTVKMESPIQTSEDLQRVRLRAAKNSSGEEYLFRECISSRAYEDIELALGSLINDEIDAVVSNVPVLRRYKHTRYRNKWSSHQSTWSETIWELP